MRCYKVKTYEDIERNIDIYCMIFGILFCLAYFVIVTGLYLTAYQTILTPCIKL
jgi:hypothetical protein